MRTERQVETVLDYIGDTCELVIEGWSRNVRIEKGREPSRSGWDHINDSKVIAVEVERVLDKVIRELVTADAEERKIARRERKKHHKNVMKTALK